MAFDTNIANQGVGFSPIPPFHAIDTLVLSTGQFIEITPAGMAVWTSLDAYNAGDPDHGLTWLDFTDGKDA